MNKTQEFDIMQMRAKIQVDEIVKQHKNLMDGEEPELINDTKGDGKTSEELFESLEE